MIDHWTRNLRQRWGLSATLVRLDGEYDLNFAVRAESGREYVLKVMRADCDDALVDMQIAALDHISRNAPGLPFPEVIPALDGTVMGHLPDPHGHSRLVWMLGALPGRAYAVAAPKSFGLIGRLGRALGAADRVLEGFEHPRLRRDFKWNLTQAGWIAGHLDRIDSPARRVILNRIAAGFSALKPQLDALPKQAIHNDLNDYNILVEGQLSETRRISGLIDLGDMCLAPRICDLAIAGAYVVLDHDRPERALAELVRGYHATNRLTPAELDLVWPLLRMRLAVSVVNAALMAADRPGDPYVTVTQAPAWRFLERDDLAGDLMPARLRAACDLPVAEGADRVRAFLDAERGRFAPLLGRDLATVPMGSLSVEQSTWPRNPFDLPPDEAARVGAEFGDGLWLGYYREPRLIYTGDGFRKGKWKASDRRTVHLAIDVFAPAGTTLFAPMDARVCAVENRDRHLDYGGVVILEHETPGGDRFYSLYGHLDPEICTRLGPGDRVGRGQQFARLGDPARNGGWTPHAHVQLALTTQGMRADWPGVGDPDEIGMWTAICPNPAALLNLPDDRTRYAPASRPAVLAGRRDHFAANLNLSYDDPVMPVRGWKHHLFDQWGRPYLDAYNNVPHVGHAHPRIQAAAADQLKRINTNTRYLHPAQNGLAEKILSKLPAHLQICFFVNSGTEANELALRLARAHTGARGMITPDHGYHGHSTGTVDISAYKFNAPGGPGKPDWVELVDQADDFGGRFRRDDPDRAAKFAALSEPAIAALHDRGHGLAGFIAETFPSVGGQIIPPPGYLAAVYDRVRAAGGICIADEVQTGLGRLGSFYFGFEHQQAEPDIVVLGKPLGNGHPIGAVITTRAIADSFARGPEFFSTFGGSTLSCRIGREVLEIVDDEALQDNARRSGDRLIQGLRAIARRHPLIGDVRGIGLFVGVELVDSDTATAPEICTYVQNRLREFRILIGSEGPRHTVLKIRPPLTIDNEGVDMLLWALDMVLGEI